jgi:hypothetical protein
MAEKTPREWILQIAWSWNAAETRVWDPGQARYRLKSVRQSLDPISLGLDRQIQAKGKDQ